MNTDRMGKQMPLPTNPAGERQVAAALEILLDLPERSREALVRFYFHRQSAEEIQLALNFTAAEFSDLKAAARARWAAASRAAIPCQSAAFLEKQAAQIRRLA
jgi:hypothetical protein